MQAHAKKHQKTIGCQNVIHMCRSQREKVDEAYKALIGTLQEEQKSQLFDIVNELDCIGDTKTSLAFVKGFRLAAKLMIDVLY